MYVVLKSFVGKDIIGVKGKTIDIEDKNLLKSLEKENYIQKVNAKDVPNADLIKEIDKSKKSIS